MSQGPSIDAFIRTIDEKFVDFKTKVRNFYLVVASNQFQLREERAKAALLAAQTLSDYLSRPDQPPWLNQFIGALQTFVNSPSSNGAQEYIIDTYGQFYAGVLTHRWSFTPAHDIAVDFDAVFEKVKAESRIAELFDKIIEILEQIIKTDLIDSRKITATLEKIIASMKRNRTGSFFSIIGTWDFLKRFMENAAWKTASKIPGVNILSDALHETIKEYEEEMQNVYKRIAKETSEATKVEFQALDYAQLAITLDTVARNGSEIVDIKSEAQN
jgi:hypothetical protein